MRAPPRYRWAGEWLLDNTSPEVRGVCDDQGWVYAPSWQALATGVSEPRAVDPGACIVRRRRYVRPCQRLNGGTDIRFDDDRIGAAATPPTLPPRTSVPGPIDYDSPRRSHVPASDASLPSDLGLSLSDADSGDRRPLTKSAIISDRSHHPPTHVSGSGGGSSEETPDAAVDALAAAVAHLEARAAEAAASDVDLDPESESLLWESLINQAHALCQSTEDLYTRTVQQVRRRDTSSTDHRGRPPPSAVRMTASSSASTAAATTSAAPVASAGSEAVRNGWGSRRSARGLATSEGSVADDGRSHARSRSRSRHEVAAIREAQLRVVAADTLRTQAQTLAARIASTIDERSTETHRRRPRRAIAAATAATLPPMIPSRVKSSERQPDLAGTPSSLLHEEIGESMRVQVLLPAGPADDLAVHQFLAEERSREFQAIAREAIGLKEVMTTLSTMVESHGDLLDDVETHVDHAAHDAERGLTHVQRLADTQESGGVPDGCVTM